MRRIGTFSLDIILTPWHARCLTHALQAGSAVLLRTGALLGTKTLATATAARMGAGAVASHQVLMQLWVLASMVVDALAVSGQTLVAVSLGRGARGEARRLADRLLQLGGAAGLGLAAAAALGAPWWMGLFSRDAEVRRGLGTSKSITARVVVPRHCGQHSGGGMRGGGVAATAAGACCGAEAACARVAMSVP